MCAETTEWFDRCANTILWRHCCNMSKDDAIDVSSLQTEYELVKPDVGSFYPNVNNSKTIQRTYFEKY